MMSLCCDVLKALQGKTLVTAESLTGGGIGAALTQVPGSSEVYKGGVICYTNWVKENILGVPGEILAQDGAVSLRTAEHLASGVRALLKADTAVAVTGLAGPGGALPGKPVGTVYLAGADTRTDTGYLMRLTLGGYQDRQIIRTRAALYALDMLRRMALGLDVPDSVRFTPETADRELDI